MAQPRQADLDALIVALTEAGVEFIVVGGAAAVLHGAPVTTVDLIVVHRRTPENVERLMAVLAALESTYRAPARPNLRHLRPNAELLLGRGQNLLSTKLGPLDLLCVLHDQRGYEELLPRTEIMTDESTTIRVLDLDGLILDGLIELKSGMNRPKDRLVLPILLALRARKQ